MPSCGSRPFALLAQAQQDAIYSERDLIHPVHGRHGMVATQEATATRIGLEVLQHGGNAVDAAVTVGFALAVTLPRAGNLGGGGFMLVHDAASGDTVAIDYREKAGGNAFRDMFLDEQGEADPEKSRYSGLAVGVPGTVAGLALALERYGTISLAQALAPAIRLAEQGIIVSEDLAASLDGAGDRAAQVAVLGQDLLQGRRRAVSAGRHAGPARSRSVAQADRRAGARARSTAGRSARRSSRRSRARAAI